MWTVSIFIIILILDWFVLRAVEIIGMYRVTLIKKLECVMVVIKNGWRTK